MGDAMTAAAMKPRLSLRNQTGPRKRRRGESQTRPSPTHGKGSVRCSLDPAPPATAGQNQARRRSRTDRNFAPHQGPAARKKSKPGTGFCAPELLWKGVGVSPVNGGRGVERLWAGTPIGAHPRRSFGFFPIAGKETRPAGRNPVRRRAESLRPTGVTVRGGRAGRRPAPTAFQADRSRTGQREGQAPPLRDGWGDIPRRRTSGRPHGAAPYGVSLRPAR